MLRVDLNLTLRVVGHRQTFETILLKFYYLYPFFQNIILLPTLPYLYIDRNKISLAVKRICYIMSLFNFIEKEMKEDSAHSSAM